VLESSGAMIGAVRFIRINVFDPSIEEENTGSLVSANPAARLPADRRLVYPWIGAELVEDDFRETRNQDQIERTEDLALGWHGKIRLGFAGRAFGSDRQAIVFDASASKGLQSTGTHTLLLSAAAKGRIESGALEDSWGLLICFAFP